MKKGRKAKPTYLRILQGNPGKRALPKSELAPQPELPLPPPTLTPAQRKVWDDVVISLFRLHPGLTAGAGARRLLTRYCQAVVIADMAAAQIRSSTDLLVESSRSGPVKNPMLNIFRDMVTIERIIAAEFGMTPSARAGLELPHPALEDDPTLPLRGNK